MNIKMALLPNAMNYAGSMASSAGVSPLEDSMDKFLSNLLHAMAPSYSECELSASILHALKEDSLSASPQTSSAGSLSCAECAEPFCHHSVAPSPSASPPHFPLPKDLMCEIHCEAIRYYCETCTKIVCQECTLWDHKDHVTVLIQDDVETYRAKVRKSLENCEMGTRFIKHSIDKGVAISRTVERDAVQVSIKIRKAMRSFITAIEEREKQLLEKAAKMRQVRLTELSDQMHGLRNVLAGLAQVSEYLSKAIDSKEGVEMLLTKEKADSQIELYANMYKSLMPKDEGFLFVAPNFELVMELKKQGDITSTVYNATNKVHASCTNGASSIPSTSAPSGFADTLRAIKRPGPVAPPSSGGIIQNPGTLDKNFRKGTGHCIPGSAAPVVARQSRGPLPGVPSITFGTDGHEDGQVSRPWGLCVDKDGNIIVADRRNNRIQIFSPEGVFKLKFGCKGTSPGEFDLPAGITTDPLGRIVVVDKDNHRVQVFTPLGGFILTFGTYGKGCGQFRYPWDVAINSERHIVITDSRNYRIQLFNSEGGFMTMLMFDGVNHSRMLKGLTTPRGVCFTPQGDIIISDFENHRLLLIDSTLTSILGAKGYEGPFIGEFSRPSGIICDDEGRIVVADSKNQRVLVFSPSLEFQWELEVKGTGPEENDRPTDVGLTPQGRLVVIVEGLPDSREVSAPGKTFIQIF